MIGSKLASSRIHQEPELSPNLKSTERKETIMRKMFAAMALASLISLGAGSFSTQSAPSSTPRIGGVVGYLASGGKLEGFVEGAEVGGAIGGVAGGVAGFIVGSAAGGVGALPGTAGGAVLGGVFGGL
ncbi:MAG: hypothetical protein DMF61_01980 [Blastocatellia bacterium AA13]|nr:MAG: hypothetical protein DMF61_01980 [Blastocatellia bacterium AA13]